MSRRTITVSTAVTLAAFVLATLFSKRKRSKRTENPTVDPSV
jgi:hypothetical protein